MGFISVFIWVVSSFIFYINSSELLKVSIILGILNFWSLGIMYNYKYDDYTPRIWGFICMSTTFSSIIFLILAFLGY